MIVKLSKGKGWRGASAYLLDGSENNAPGRGAVLDTNLAGSTPRAWAREIAAWRKLRPSLGKAVSHASLSLPLGETLSDKDWQKVARRFRQGMGYDESCPFLVVKHQDTEHEHIHILALRINAGGQVVSDKNDFRRAEAVAREIEQEWGLSAPIPKPKRKGEEEMEMTITAAGGENAAASRKALFSATYEEALRQQFGEEVRVAKHRGGRGLTVFLPGGGRVLDFGGKVSAQDMGGAEAADSLIKLACVKGWQGLELRGPDEFIQAAMEEAAIRGVEVQPLDEKQKALWNEIKARRVPARIPQNPPISPSLSLKDRLLAQREAREAGEVGIRLRGSGLSQGRAPK